MRRDSNRSKSRVIAILGSDYHLRHKPSIARSGEPNWYRAMLRPLLEIESLISKHNCVNCIAGDIFHKATGNPEELIHFVQQHIPTDSVSVAGNHDCPYHNYDKLEISAYGLLQRFGVIHHLKPGHSFTRSDLNLNIHGFSWDQSLVKCVPAHRTMVELALIHKYIWKGSNKYPGAKKQDQVLNYDAKLKDLGYNAAAFGDNHLGFWHSRNGVHIINCGSLMTTNSDQRKYKPHVGLLYDTGMIGVHYLDTSKDVWLDEKELIRSIAAPNLDELMQEYKKLKGKSLNFMSMLKRAMHDERLSLRGRRIVEEVVNTYDD